MTTPSQQVATALQQHLGTQQLFIRDFSGGCDGAKLEVYVVSNRFSGMKLLERHRLVNDVVKEAGLFDQAIHALTVKAWTPEDFETKKSTIPGDALPFDK